MKPANSDPDRSDGSGSSDNSNDDFSLVSGQEELPLPPNRFGNGGERRFRQRSPARPGILSNRLTTSSRLERPAEWQRQSFDERSFSAGSNRPNEQIYGALDLGTNNCRLLLARPSRRGFQVVDAFSRIIRLGEGVSQTGRLSELAMNRTLDALRVCAGKLHRHHVSRTRLVATQACRVAANGSSFVDKVKNIFDLDIEILTPKTEAHLAVAGCATLIDPAADYVLVFDIGGGSSEIVWLDMTRLGSRRDVWSGRSDVNDAIVAWESLPVGVVTLAEHFGGRDVNPATFAAMSKAVTELLLPFEAQHRFRDLMAGKPVHFLGTSGTVTTIAGVMLGLERYDRKRVDGIWLNVSDIDDVTSKLLGQSYEERISEPCIGRERADLVLAGCAILDAILKLWPADRLRVADRGLREGILMQLMMEDGVWRAGRRRRSRSKRSNGAEQS